MALEYFLYTTDYNNTLVDRSDTSFSPVPPYAEIHIDYFIPEIQPLYLYRRAGATIVENDQATIDAYLQSIAPPPEPDDPTPVGVFTGYTATTKEEFETFTGTTLPANYYDKTEINSYSASTQADINTRVFRSGDNMTGSLNTSGNLTAVGAVTGSSVSASVLITTPVLNASTSISAPQITGSTCITSPISCATTRAQSPVVCATTCVNSPIVVENGTCLVDKYANKTTFETYTGDTDTRLDGIDSDVVYLSGQTDLKLNIIDFNTYSGATEADINTRVYRSGDTMTGSLSTSGGLYANQSISGTSIWGSVNVLSPIIDSYTCLCSQGTTGLDGDVTIASELNVSGHTHLGDQLYLNSISTGGTLNDWWVRYDPVTCVLRSIPPEGDSNVYCYCDRRTLDSNSTTTNASYICTDWTIPDGCYELVYNAIYGNTSSNRCARICFMFDGAVVGEENLMKTNYSGVKTTSYVTQNNYVTAGTYSMEILYRARGGTAQVHYGVMRLQKIGE